MGLLFQEELFECYCMSTSYVMIDAFCILDLKMLQKWNLLQKWKPGRPKGHKLTTVGLPKRKGKSVSKLASFIDYLFIHNNII